MSWIQWHLAFYIFTISGWLCPASWNLLPSSSNVQQSLGCHLAEPALNLRSKVGLFFSGISSVLEPEAHSDMVGSPLAILWCNVTLCSLMSLWMWLLAHSCLSLLWSCCSLNVKYSLQTQNVLYRLVCSNTRSPAVSTVWKVVESLRGRFFKVRHWFLQPDLLSACD